MAATNFTPIILYHTTTASAAPTAGNLNNGELAINITDGKLFYKDNGGTVQVIATKGTGTIGGSNTQVQYNSSGALAGSANFTFNGTTATINTLNLTNALGTAYGGTALTTYTQGDLVYASAANTLAKLGIGANTYILTSTGSVPQWSAPSAVTVSTANNLAGGAAGSVPYQSGAGVTTFLSIGSAGQVLTSSGTAPQWSNLSSLGVTSLSFGTTGLTPSTATQGAITVAGTLATTNGGTGLTSFTANGVFYASSTSAVGQSANLTFDGTTLVASNLTDSSLTTGRVVYTTTGGNLTDSANLLYSGTDLTVYGITVGRGAGAVSTNTAVGASALAANTTGQYNSAFGWNTLLLNTTGLANTAVGYQALRANTTGGTNSALGDSALAGNTTGNNNAAVGQGALASNTTASDNTAVGYQAGYANTTGTRNSFFGHQAGLSVTTGSFNTGIGSQVFIATLTGSENTAVGYGSSYSMTSGQYNTAVGRGSLFSNTTASENTAVGYQAGYTATTTGLGVYVGYQAGYTNNGANFTAVGYQAGYANTTAANTTAFGLYALKANTTGDSNTALGSTAMQSNTTGAYNTAVGTLALQANTTANYNTAVGYQVAYLNTTGYNNAAFGTQALYANTTGFYNTAIGDSSFGSNTTGSYNTAVGRTALYSNTTASNNTAVGYQAGYSNTTGAGNVLIGLQAGYSNTTNSYNTFVGWQAGYLTTGTENTFVGKRAGYNATTGAYNTFVGSGGYGAGQEITTGSKNTILGAYNGNQGGLDIRTASNNIVLSDGDGNPRLVSPGTANWSLGAPVSGVTWRSDAPTLILPYGGLRSEQYTAGNTQVKLTNNAYEATDTSYKYITSDTASMYIQINGVHKWESAASGTAGNTITFTQILQGEKDKSLALQGASSQSGTGITFPATQSASSNANTLDDYEEGTFTPTLSFGGSSTGITYSYQNGLYIKVGRLVFVRVGIVITNKGSGSGVAKFSGFPFTVESISYADAVGPTSYGGMTGLISPVNIVMNNGSTEAQFRQFNSTTEANLTDAEFTNSSYIYGSFCYNVA